MLSPEKDRIIVFTASIALFALLFVAVFLGLLWPASPELQRGEPVSGNNAQESITFSVDKGESFRSIANRLSEAGIIRSSSAFKIYALVTGGASKLKPGIYELKQSMSMPEIMSELVGGPEGDITVVIQDSASVYEIDKILAEAGILLNEGELPKFALKENLEGRLFPDTYRFFYGSEVEDVVEKFSENFKRKTAELFGKISNDELNRVLILASLVEKEVPDYNERKVVAGILEKRLKAGMALQVDATICYIKKVRAYPNRTDCRSFAPLDFRRDSPYNTYLYRGLPPTPIGNPGISAIKAVLEAEKSPYWYYLSDPETKKTIFAKTLEEHNENRAKYLGL